jgi:hypothetical protein
MKSKEIIKRLQEIDPTGECEVSFGGDIFEFVRLPWYYDGRASIFIKNDEGDIIGMREATEDDGDKIVGYTKTLYDLGSDEADHNHYSDKKIAYIIEGDDYFKSIFEKGKADTKKIFEEIEAEEKRKLNRQKIGVLIYKDPCDYYGDNVGRVQFYWGGDGWSDPSVLDVYHNAEKIISNHFDNNEEKYDEFLDDVLPHESLAVLLENDYTTNKTFEETVDFFTKKETGWKWVNGIPDAYTD